MSFPKLIVFDCDMCLWSPEMYELHAPPLTPVRGDLNGKGDGTCGASNGEDVVTLFAGALQVQGPFPSNSVARREVRPFLCH